MFMQNKHMQWIYLTYTFDEILTETFIVVNFILMACKFFVYANIKSCCIIHQIHFNQTARAKYV